MPQRKKILFEDLANMTAQQDKWNPSMKGQGMGTPHGPQVVTLLDLLKNSDVNKQHPNNAAAPGPDIYGSQHFVQLLGDLFVQVEQIQAAITIAKRNPVIADNDGAHVQVDTMIKKLRMIKKLIESIGVDIDNFTVDIEDQ